MEMEDFSPHQFNPLRDQEFKLYHIYDGLSQTPYIPGHGIEAGDKNIYFIRYWYRITLRSIAQHLDWEQREPTSFISLSDDLDWAWRKAHQRASHRDVKVDGRWQSRGAVFIAVVSASKLAEAGVFFFSTQDLRSERMLGASRTAQLAGRLQEREWFVMDWIPEAAVERVVEVPLVSTKY